MQSDPWWYSPQIQTITANVTVSQLKIKSVLYVSTNPWKTYVKYLILGIIIDLSLLAIFIAMVICFKWTQHGTDTDYIGFASSDTDLDDNNSSTYPNHHITDSSDISL